MKYSVIVPVFNRPDEVDELLESLCSQSFKDFEVLIIEDGSDKCCRDVVEKYSNLLDVKYYLKANSGPGQTRNYGAALAKGEYLIVLDSDTMVPSHYFDAIESELNSFPCEAFGGPDRSHHSFTPTQKAISFAMTSFITTGGIRGGKKKLDKFYPRSFNMGIRKSVYDILGGFSKMRYGEDVDFSMRILEAGFSSRLFPEAWVWHKRRAKLSQFFKQVHNSGIARVNLSLLHPGSLKLVHLLPGCFTAGCIALIICAPFCVWSLTPLLLYALLAFVLASLRERNLKVGLISAAASYVQLIGYGTGLFRGWWHRCVKKDDPDFQAYRNTFYR